MDNTKKYKWKLNWKTLEIYQKIYDDVKFILK